MHGEPVITFVDDDNKFHSHFGLANPQAECMKTYTIDYIEIILYSIKLVMHGKEVKHFLLTMKKDESLA